MEAPHILVIDDEKEITDLIEIYLSQECYHVEKRYNALTLLEDIRTYQIDLVILDVMMPEINGIQALKMIREKYNIPVIIVSAKTADNDKIEGLLTGADDYVSKPFNAMELVARVKSQLRRFQVFNKPINDSSHIIEASDLIIDLSLIHIFSSPKSKRTCLIASINGKLSISPTVPPISVITMSA